jgi:5-methylcytosine-specific restriction protein A
MAMLKLCRCGKQINLADETCPECKELQEKRDHKRYDSKRGNAFQRGYDAKWKKYRVSFLRKNPLCVQCLEEGRITPATVVDHKVAHKGDNNLFWDPSNHQTLCKHHHDKKTATHDMGSWNVSEAKR